MRLASVLASVGVLAACKPSAPPPPDPDAWLGPCLDGFAAAKAQPSWQRARTIVEACTPCGVPWRDAIRVPMPAPGVVLAVVDACHLDCPAPARGDLSSALKAVEGDQAPRAAWAKFARACPQQMSGAGPDDRYAGGAWFALDQIARRLGAARAHLAPVKRTAIDEAFALELRLPLWSSVGTGFELPAGPSTDAPIDRYVTITEKDVFLGAAPIAHVGEHGVTVTGGWPGRGVGLDQLRAEAGSNLAVVAPGGLPAARVLEVVRALRVSLPIAVAADRDHTLFGAEVGVLARPLPTGDDPPADTPVITTKTDLAHASLPARATVVVDPGDATFDELAALLQRLPPGWTPVTRATPEPSSP